MKRAANILFLVAGILSIVLAVCFVITSIVFFAIAASEPFIKEMIANGTIVLPEGQSAETYLAVFIAICITYGVVFLVFGLLNVPNAIFAFKGRRNSNKALFILNIVFGFLSGVLLNVIGGILALASMEDKK